MLAAAGERADLCPTGSALPGSLMRTVPETTRTTADLPGTGGGGGPAGGGAGAARGAVVLRNTLSVLAWSLEAARSGLPSPLKSPAATPLAPGAGQRRAVGREAAARLAQQRRDRAGGVARHREVGSPVGVEVGRRQAERAGADRDRRLRGEAAARVAQQHVDRVRPEHRHRDVGVAVAVEVGRLDALGRGADRDRRGLRREAGVARRCAGAR